MNILMKRMLNPLPLILTTSLQGRNSHPPSTDEETDLHSEKEKYLRS